MAKLVIILLIGLVFEAIGVVFLNKGLRQIGEMRRVSPAEMLRVVKAGAANPHLVTGVFFEALFFACLLTLLAKADVSFVWPLTALGFVLTTLAAKLFLHEHVSGWRWTGVAFIMLGAALVTWTERAKAQPAPAEVRPPSEIAQQGR
jgi:drug/metabolite transporter (DMT)-like permease